MPGLKILLLSSEVPPGRAGGIASYTAVVAPALAARGHDVHVLSCAPEHERSDERVDGVSWHRRPLLAAAPSPQARFPHATLRLITAASVRAELTRLRERFDVIESPEWLAESLLLSNTFTAPIVVHLHTPAHILFSFDRPRLNGDLRIADRLERASARRARAVTTASRVLADIVRGSSWLERDPEIVPLPVDTAAWSADPVPAGTPTVLVAGRLEPRKAPELAVRAVAELAAEVPGISLVLAGRSRGHRDGRPYAEWLRAEAERAGIAVAFEGQVTRERMRELYARARVVAVPSRFESFSMVALEAMASSRPVVVSSRVGAGPLVDGMGAGAVFADGDASALAAALRPFVLSLDHARAAGAHARTIAERECGPDIIAARREAVYERVARRRRVRT